MKVNSGKLILDPCCGSKGFWFDKNHPNVLFGDIRKGKIQMTDRILEIKPDMEIDFTCMPFEDETFHLVVFDPPHIDNLGKNSRLAQKYGQLFPSWRTDINAGFKECLRVLKRNGVLIFKWNESRIKTKTLIDVIGMTPLFGHTTDHKGRTVWMCFMK